MAKILVTVDRPTGEDIRRYHGYIIFVNETTLEEAHAFVGKITSEPSALTALTLVNGEGLDEEYTVFPSEVVKNSVITFKAVE
jgi:hypothetical protein